MIVFYIFIIVTVTFIFKYVWSRRRFYMLGFKLPGPNSLPFLGIAHKFLEQNKILKTLDDYSKHYGSPIFSYLCTYPFVLVSDPNTVEKILTSPQCTNKAELYIFVANESGDGLFTLKNPKWSYHRKLLNPTFHHQVLMNFFPIFNEQVDILNSNFEKYAGQGELDIRNLLQKCTLDTACQTVMGQNMNFQLGCNIDIFEAYHNLITVTTRRILRPWLQVDLIFRMTSMHSKAKKSQKIVKDFIETLIQRKDNQTKKPEFDVIPKQNETEIKKSPNIFLDWVYSLYQTKQFSWTDVEDESNVMIVAAYETTSNVLYVILMCLAMFPKYQNKLYEEILSIFPDKGFSVNYEDTMQITYLEKIINETLRLLAPVPVVARSCSDDFDLGDGIILPKGLQIGIDIFNMQRNEKYWGPNAKTFDPEHFSKENLQKRHNYAFIPFTKGIRNCIGWRYALLSIKVMVIKMIRKYEFSTEFKFENLKFVEDIVLRFEPTPLLSINLR